MKLTHIDTGKPFDWGKASQDYAKYRDIYPPLFYEKIREAGLCVQNQTVLDLGTGTGVLPRSLSAYGAKFVGTDISTEQIEQAKLLSAAQGLDITYLACPTEELDFPAQSFDVVTACQCFFYFDKAVVLPKIHWFLKDDGTLCILYLNWLPKEDTIAAATEKLVLQYNPTWSGAGFAREHYSAPSGIDDLFTVAQEEVFDLALPFTRESWHGRIKACRGIGASSLSPAEIAAFEQEHLAMLQALPEPFEIKHAAYMLCLQKK